MAHFLSFYVSRLNTKIMEKLNIDWLTEGWLDSEHKRYLFLAYLQRVEKRFNKAQLYPPLTDLIEHQKALLNLRDKADQLENNFPKDLKKIDLKNLQIIRNNQIKKDEIIQYITQMVEFALPKLKKSIEQGKELYDLVENNLQIEQVGLSPIYQKEGYLFLQIENTPNIDVYRFHLSLIENLSAKYQAIKMEYIMQETKTISNSIEHIKLNLIRSFRELPNPATYLIHSTLKVPVVETLLPISKRILIKQLVQI